jgi:hypothetical protein
MKRIFWAKAMVLVAMAFVAAQSGVLAQGSRAQKALDAVVDWGNGKAYFFKGSRYVRFDMKAMRVDPDYPKNISEWRGMPWTDGIDAAFNLGNGKAYFFKGSEYIRWDIAADHMDPGYPKPISTPTAWTGLPWTDGFDAVINLGNGKLFFFKGAEYIQYDLKTDKADPGYPKRITQLTWPGLASIIYKIEL